ncbi:MAG: hypothetical protein HYX38_20930 [Rhodospirillales bacterium]|nr:hypothetical protein [Rhodospirillales bacterium]
MMTDPSVAPSVDPGSIKPGTHVRFVMERVCDGAYLIDSIAPATGGHS